MGRDAKVAIWVGVTYDGAPDDFVSIHEGPDGSTSYLPSCLPKDVKDALLAYPPAGPLLLESGEPWFEGTLTAGQQVVVQEPRAGDEPCGLGVVVFAHDWDYGVVPFELEGVRSAIDRWLPMVRDLFASWGIALPVGVWCSTDYS